MPIIATTAEPNRKPVVFINSKHRTTPRPRPPVTEEEPEYEYYYEYYYDDDVDDFPVHDPRKPVKAIDDYDIVPLVSKVI